MKISKKFAIFAMVMFSYAGFANNTESVKKIEVQPEIVSESKVVTVVNEDYDSCTVTVTVTQTWYTSNGDEVKHVVTATATDNTGDCKKAEATATANVCSAID